LIVVSDTSPILNLARIGRLDLLRLLYRQVLVPSSVHQELIASLATMPSMVDLGRMPWLLVATAADQNRVRELRSELDPGEAEAIVLAVERSANLLLMDERRGRRIANSNGLTVTGLLGVVAAAKHAGLIDLAKPVVDELVQTARFWIGADLYADVLRQLGEA
jgi:predicted nucleic acid-binding protein